MADVKKSTKTATDLAKERERLVRQANEEQKLTAKNNQITKASSNTSRDTTNSIIRDKSLEEKYLEKFKSSKKSSTKAVSSKSTARATASTSSASRVQTKTGTTVKVAGKSAPTNAEQDVRVGNVVVDKELVDQKTGILSSKKDRQKTLVIITLAILLILTLLLSTIFIVGSLSNANIGKLEISGSGAEWLINGKADRNFGVRGEIFAGCSIQELSIELKKTTSANIKVKVVFEAYYKDKLVPKENYDVTIRTIYSADNKFVVRDGDYYIDDWNATIGADTNTALLCEIINISSALTDASNSNINMVFTAYVEAI